MSPKRLFNLEWNRISFDNYGHQIMVNKLTHFFLAHLNLFRSIWLHGRDYLADSSLSFVCVPKLYSLWLFSFPLQSFTTQARNYFPQSQLIWWRNCVQALYAEGLLLLRAPQRARALYSNIRLLSLCRVAIFWGRAGRVSGDWLGLRLPDGVYIHPPSRLRKTSHKT